MPRFRVVRGTGLVAFLVADETGQLEPHAERFLTALGLRDLSPYTILAYARGLAHFHGWCLDHCIRLAEVTPTRVQAYVEDFRWSGEGERAAATTALGLASSRARSSDRHGSDAPEWRDKTNPVRPAERLERAVPMRRRAERLRADLRRRQPRRLPIHLSAEEIEAVYGAATSWRDRALLRLLEWSGQRIGDWDAVHGRHGTSGCCERRPPALGLSCGPPRPRRGRTRHWGRGPCSRPVHAPSGCCRARHCRRRTQSKPGRRA